MTGTENGTLLLCEDDPGHAMLVTKNLRLSDLKSKIVNVENGQQALDFMFGSPGKEANHSPLIILLDLNMPGVDGFQVLERVKSDEKTKCIPVIILTTTENMREINKCYELGCNSYITKPMEYEVFSKTIRMLGNFLAASKIPER